jgi:Fur family ferric uptake transcriptional regulator
MECLNPESLTLDSDAFGKTFPGRIDKVEVRLDGICKNCMR